MLNGRPRIPMRVWRNRIGPPSKSRIASAPSSQNGGGGDQKQHPHRHVERPLQREVEALDVRAARTDERHHAEHVDAQTAVGPVRHPRHQPPAQALLLAQSDDPLVLLARRVGQHDSGFKAGIEGGDFAEALGGAQHRAAAILAHLAIVCRGSRPSRRASFRRESGRTGSARIGCIRSAPAGSHSWDWRKSAGCTAASRPVQRRRPGC